MTRSLKRVGPKRLHERLTPAAWPRELQPLASAFDAMLDRLEDSFRRLSQFSADLAHELRTPIANIRGESEVALTRSRTPEEYRHVVESVLAECERLSGLIDNLLFLARAEAADGKLERIRFDAAEAARKVMTYYEPVAEERHVSIRCEGGGDIYAEPMLFSRALSNLVENALRFTPDGGEIVIAISANSADAEVAVSDNGSGIPAKHLPQIFDRFYRVDSSRSSRGTGLGLALVKSIAELHGGSVDATSEEGRGTRVVLHFPGVTS
jgi:two-component system heavy metal sensor histidine kinase CusS